MLCAASSTEIKKKVSIVNFCHKTCDLKTSTSKSINYITLKVFGLPIYIYIDIDIYIYIYKTLLLIFSLHIKL